ncbi:MAG: 5-formyltetrahydrofolate cyclo-ligase [Firmicutes bacterium]|nr:5-formyltetrahydrofolate cyclo-ligase [Bacillota bacterium]
MDKSEVRKKYLQVRQNIKDRDSKNQAIFDRLLGLKVIDSHKKILCYANMGGEVSTQGVFEYCLKNNIKIWQPIILPNGQMSGQRVNTIKDVKYHSPTNISTAKAIAQKFDVLIVPLVATDNSKNRLGRGGGYYDKFLANYQKPSFATIGLAFDEQVLSEPIPIEPHDRSLNIIITPTRTI